MHVLYGVLVVIELHIPLCLIHTVHLVYQVHKLLVNDSQHNAFVLETQTFEPLFSVF